MAEGAGLYISDSEPQAIANAVKRALKGNGKVSRSALIKTLDHKYRASDLNGAMSLLIQSGEVEVEEVPQPPGKAGGPAFGTLSGLSSSPNSSPRGDFFTAGEELAGRVLPRGENCSSPAPPCEESAWGKGP